ncbi:MAG: hypothetical protein ACTSXQ_01380 [Alphaproteobacteria bacterium]
MNEINSMLGGLQRQSGVSSYENLMSKKLQQANAGGGLNDISDVNEISQAQMPAGMELMDLDEKAASLLSMKLGQMLENTRLSVANEQQKIVANLLD